ncbi:MAG TPA: hypothetical protein VKR58_01040 [Aquella sp.]|nr:hypothetical protein [Aquella sp.]
MDIINEYKDIALSNSDVLKLVNGKANIILYPELVNYNSIDEILEPYGACFLLFEARLKPFPYGHWCCLFKLDNQTIEFFNPYGGYPDDSLEYIPMDIRKQSNQDYPYLSWLMINSPYDLTYNEHKFQKHGNNIKTCGRWCAVRLLCRNSNLEQFTKIFKNKNGDELVTLVTMWINK